MESKDYKKLVDKEIQKEYRKATASEVNTLCDCEKFNILFNPELADLNKKSEFYSHCMHKKSKLLIKKKRGRKKKGPG